MRTSYILVGMTAAGALAGFLAAIAIVSADARPWVIGLGAVALLGVLGLCGTYFTSWGRRVVWRR